MPVEKYVEESPLIDRCVVNGDAQGDRVATITINEAEAANMCREQIDGLIEQALERASSRVPDSEQIKRWVIDHKI